MRRIKYLCPRRDLNVSIFRQPWIPLPCRSCLHGLLAGESQEPYLHLQCSVLPQFPSVHFRTRTIRLETFHQCGATPTAQLETPVLETHLALRPLPHRGRIITFEVWMRDSRYWLVLIQLHLCLLISCDRFTGAQNIYHVGQMHSRVCISMSCSSQLKYLCKTDSLTDIFWEAWFCFFFIIHQLMY